MELAVCYARVSTVEQAQHGVSLDAQVDRLVSYCTNMGLQVIRVIKEDPISATKPLITRPGGRKMLESLAEGEVRHVVAMKLDRLFRSTRDALDNVTRWGPKQRCHAFGGHGRNQSQHGFSDGPDDADVNGVLR